MSATMWQTLEQLRQRAMAIDPVKTDKIAREYINGEVGPSVTRKRYLEVILNGT